MINVQIDYGKFYNLEQYLFNEVQPKFAVTGSICTLDFFLIVIWKSNRAKSKTKKRLAGLAGGSFASAVEQIAKSMVEADSPKRQLQVLMEEWGFLLPMATAILTVLYPDEFTVYDIRVCDVLGRFHELGTRKFSGKLWGEYLEFVHAVAKAAPAGLTLRNQDRYLWGRSFYEQAIKDVG